MRPVADPCPWCRAATGFRELTYGEVLRRLPVTLIHSAASAAANVWRPTMVTESITASTASRRCVACSGLVRQCPHCDRPERLVSGMATICRGCQRAYQ